ncbi:MAG: hypothetical protein R2758_08215 [Bacteroidales bacterium]
MLEDHGTKVLKFFLNVSKKAQEERLIERIEMEEKHWKHKDGDWDTRAKFDQYMKVYEKILNRCNDIPDSCSGRQELAEALRRCHRSA